MDSMNEDQRFEQVQQLCNKNILSIKKLLHNKNVLRNGYKKIQKDEVEEQCAICLEEYKIGLYKRTLNCNHTFHKKCIDKWIGEKLSCPICRNSVSGN